MINNNIKNIVIIGGGLAGDTATAALREAGYTGGIQLVSDELHRPYDRPPLSKAALLAPDEAAKIHFRAAEWYAENNVELILGDGAAKLDPAAHQVTLRSGRVIGYDKLLIATGTRARRLRMLETTGAPVFYLRSLDDCEALRPLLVPGAKIVLIGAGVIGMEVAASAAQRGLAVTVIGKETAPFEKQLGARIGNAFVGLHRRKGVTFRLGQEIEALHGDGAVQHIILDNGERIPADLVVIGFGVRPVTDYVTGVTLDKDGGITVDATLKAADGLFAAGDIARFVNPVDDFVFAVALVKAKFEAEFFCQGPAVSLNIRQGFVSVDVGLAFAEQVEVGTVQYVNQAAHGLVPSLSLWAWEHSGQAVTLAERPALSVPARIWS